MNYSTITFCGVSHTGTGGAAPEQLLELYVGDNLWFVCTMVQGLYLRYMLECGLQEIGDQLMVIS